MQQMSLPGKFSVLLHSKNTLLTTALWASKPTLLVVSVYNKISNATTRGRRSELSPNIQCQFEAELHLTEASL